MRIVFDTNLLISAVFFGGKPHELLNLIRQGVVDVVVTSEILLEYEKSITKFSKAEDIGTHWREYFYEFGVLVDVKRKFSICRDPDDNKFLDAAHAGKVDFIVSGDKDLRDIKNFHIPIVNVAEFLTRIKAENS